MPQLADELDLCPQRHQAADDQRILALGVRQADHQTVVNRLDVLHKGQGAQSYQPGRIHLCQVEYDLASVQFGAQILRGINRDQAGFENANAVAQSVSFVQVVSAQENGASQRFELLDTITAQFGGFRVQGAGGFVQEARLRLVQQSAGDGQFLPHTLGEAAHLVKAPVP